MNAKRESTKSSRPTFLELLNLLTDSTQRKVLRDDGTMTRVVAEGLLVQLRSAMFGGLEGTGGSSAFGSKPPIDAAASDLLEQITDEAAQVLRAARPTPTPLGHAESYVRLWAALVTEDQDVQYTVRSAVTPQTDPKTYVKGKPSVFDERMVTTAYGLLASWVDRVEAFFNPPSSVEIPEPCPACGARYVERFKDGQMIRSNALNLHRERATGRTTEAKCSACGAAWAPNQFEFLAELVGATPAVLQEIKEARGPRLVLSQACDAGLHEVCEFMACECSCGHKQKGSKHGS